MALLLHSYPSHVSLNQSALCGGLKWRLRRRRQKESIIYDYLDGSNVDPPFDSEHPAAHGNIRIKLSLFFVGSTIVVNKTDKFKLQIQLN